MPRRIAANTTRISRSGIPLSPPQFTPETRPPPPPRPTNPVELAAKVALAETLYEEYGSYVRVAEVLEVNRSTVRAWLRKHRRRGRPATAAELLERLEQNDELAIDRIEEGLLEADPVEGAQIGLKYLHGRGHLRAHQASKIESLGTTELKVTFTVEGQKAAAPVIEGAIVGQPLSLGTAVEEDEEGA
jgi:transposase-like protein